MQQPVAGSAHCAIIGADRLPAGLAGDAICSAIRSAVREKAPRAAFAVDVRVESASSLAATIRFNDGRTLPEQKMAVSDRVLNSRSIERFAAAVADAIAGSAAP